MNLPGGPPAPAATDRPLPAAAQVGTRLTVLLFVFCLWSGLIVLRLAQFMIVQRGRTLEAMTRDAVFEGVVPAARGRILDRNGRVLAWSERLFDIHWRVPRDLEQGEAMRRVFAQVPWLQAAIPQPLRPEHSGTRLELAHDQPAERVVQLEALSEQLPGLEITARFQRHVVPDPALRHYLGQVRCRADGTEVGISGVELGHDDILQGLPGAFQVMLDKEGRWLPETWQKVSDLCPGFDVQLPLRTEPAEGHSP